MNNDKFRQFCEFQIENILLSHTFLGAKKTNSLIWRQISRINWNNALKMISFDHNRRRSNVFENAKFLILPKFVQILPKFFQILSQENFLGNAAASLAYSLPTLHWFRYCFCAVTVSKLQFYSWLSK